MGRREGPGRRDIVEMMADGTATDDNAVDRQIQGCLCRVVAGKSVDDELEVVGLIRTMATKANPITEQLDVGNADVAAQQLPRIYGRAETCGRQEVAVLLVQNIHIVHHDAVEQANAEVADVDGSMQFFREHG